MIHSFDGDDPNHPGVITDTWGPVTAVPTDTIPTRAVGRERDKSVTTTTGTDPAAVTAPRAGEPTPATTSGKPGRKAGSAKRTAKKKRAGGKRKHPARNQKTSRKANKKKQPACGKRKSRRVCRNPNVPLPPGPATTTVGPDGGAPLVPGPVFVTGPVPAPTPRSRVVSGLSDAGVSSVRVHTRTVYNEGLPADLVNQFTLDGTMLPTTGTTAVSVVSPTGPGPGQVLSLFGIDLPDARILGWG